MSIRKSKAIWFLTFFMLLLLSNILFTSKNVRAASTGTVTTSSLNVRSSASTTSTIVATLNKGTTVTIDKTIKDTKGSTWYYIQTKISSNTVRGYVNSSYIKTAASSTTAASASFVPTTGVVNETYLNIRAKASASAAKLGVAKKNQKVTVLEKTLIGSTTWYKITVFINSKSVTGYVNGKYITLDKTTMKNTYEKLADITTEGTYVYKTANTKDRILVTLSKNQSVLTLGNLTVGSTEWTKVKVKVDGTTYTGYLKSKYVKNIKATVSSTENEAGKISVKTHLRTIASSLSTSKGLLSADTKITITGQLSVKNTVWYKCRVVIDGTAKSGYVLASKSLSAKELAFLEDLTKFPASYHSYLTALHKKYPNWKFEAVDTGYTWKNALTAQSKTGLNTLASLAPNGGSTGTNSAPLSYLSKDEAVYDKTTNTYQVIADGNQYSVISSVIAYYMDPRNFLSEKYIFQFEQLNSTTRKEEVKNALSKTFMNGSYEVTDSLTNEVNKGSYLTTFVQAGNTYNLNATFLAARAKQMLTMQGNHLSSGTDKDYPGIYDFFHIGGLNYASNGTSYLRPWTNPEVSILGGANYLSSKYVKKKQNTIYTQKFNFVNGPVTSNQYTTNLKAPMNEANSLYLAYRDADTLSEAHTFYIPVFSKMPASVCELP